MKKTIRPVLSSIDDEECKDFCFRIKYSDRYYYLDLLENIEKMISRSFNCEVIDSYVSTGDVDPKPYKSGSISIKG